MITAANITILDEFVNPFKNAQIKLSADFAMLLPLRKLEERKRPRDEFNLLRNHVMCFPFYQSLSASEDCWYGE